MQVCEPSGTIYDYKRMWSDRRPRDLQRFLHFTPWLSKHLVSNLTALKCFGPRDQKLMELFEEGACLERAGESTFLQGLSDGV